MKTLLFFILLPFFTTGQNYKYKNLVLEGGGIRGFAYPGALQVLEQKGIIKNIENIAGCSAGANTAMMLALNYSSDEIVTVLDKLKLKQFKDGKGIFGIVSRMKKEYGVFKGDKFEKWLGQLIKDKTGIPDLTFLQLHKLHSENNNFKDLYCIGTNITQQRIQIFSWEHTPEMQIKTAVHISSCLPIYFKPVAIDSAWRKVSIKKNNYPFDLYIDGGMVANYPINIFDTCINGGNPLICDNVKYNDQSLGLKLEREEQIKQFNNNSTDVAPYNITSLNDYLDALLNEMMESLARKTPDLRNETGRTIYISHGKISGKLKNISPATKKQLYDNGSMAAQKFFNSK
ncbi:MAG TPA: patatin-like phospholipase family protein [Chitinophagaceae bacterium]|nr:patatin-like phospholipase family protein [Chitinophagaceae bacterium]